MFASNVSAGLLGVCIVLGTTLTTTATVCYFGRAPDRDSNHAYRWMIPVKDPCRCRELVLGGVNTFPAQLPYQVTYYDTFLLSRNVSKIQGWLNCAPSPVFSHCPVDDVYVIDQTDPYTIPSAIDADTGAPLTVSCSPSQATNFTRNPSLVTCRATDAAGNTATQECTFSVKLVCLDPLGMEDGGIPDSSLSASDYRKIGYGVERSRLNINGAWCSATIDRNQWIRVDLNGPTAVTGLITQGRHFSDVWMTSYQVQYSDDGTNWSDVTSTNGSAILFQGNVDCESPVTNYFPAALKTRFIQIRPLSWTRYICLRFELLGCRSE